MSLLPISEKELMEIESKERPWTKKELKELNRLRKELKRRIHGSRR